MLRMHFRRQQPSPRVAGGISQWLQAAQASATVIQSGDLVVDITSVETVNSRELGEIARLQLALRDRGQRLVLENAQRQVHDVFELTRMNRLVDVLPADAVSAVAEHSFMV